MAIFQVDCWFSRQRPPSCEDWRRFVIAADTATEAELIACLWAGRDGTRYVAASIVVDWEGN